MRLTGPVIPVWKSIGELCSGGKAASLRFRLGVLVFSGVTLWPSGPALGGVQEYLARCRGPVNLPSPRDRFRARGLDPDNPCPTQSRIDKQSQCHDAAQVLHNMYEIILEEKAKACEAAQLAASRAAMNCKAQDSCLQAQQAAMDAFRKAVRSELRLVKDYIVQTDTSMDYAVERVASDGVELLKWVRADGARRDDGSRRFGPDGRGGAAEFLKARSNQDALSSVFRHEDEQRARAVVDKFMKRQGSDSDITSIKSGVIREPLQVAQSGREWKKDLLSYQKRLEQLQSSLALSGQKAGLGARDLAPAPSTPGRSANPADRVGVPLKNTDGLAQDRGGSAPQGKERPGRGVAEGERLLKELRTEGTGDARNGARSDASGAFSQAMNAAGAMAQGLGQLAASGREQAARYPEAQADEAEGGPEEADGKSGRAPLATGDPAAAPMGPGTGKTTAPAEGEVEAKPASVAGPVEAGGGTPGLSFRSGAGSSTGGPAGAGENGRDRDAGSGRLRAGAAHSGQGTAGSSLPPLEPGEKGGEGTQGHGPVSMEPGGGILPLQMPMGAGPEERIVSGIVKEWAGALRAGDENGEQFPREQGMGGSGDSVNEGRSLFHRVHFVHVRALRKGSLLRLVPSRL